MTRFNNCPREKSPKINIWISTLVSDRSVTQLSCMHACMTILYTIDLEVDRIKQLINANVE